MSDLSSIPENDLLWTSMHEKYHVDYSNNKWEMNQTDGDEVMNWW